VVAALLALVASASSREELSADKAVEAAAPPSVCGEQCQNKYDVKADLLRSCESGCRLLSIIDAISIGDRSGGEEGAAASINNCNRSCDASYPNDIEVATACKQGCLYQAPVVSHRKRVLVSPPINSWFDDGDVNAEDEEEGGGFGFPLFGRTFHIGIPVSIRRISLPSFFGQPPSASGPEGSPAAPPQPEFEDPFAAMEREVQSALPSGFGFGSSSGDIFGGVRSMFDQMHQRMQSMMRNAVHEAEVEGPSPFNEVDSGHGRMTVFRSGPGYSSKKTYDFGPDGVVTKTEEENSGDRINGDMLARHNPLERYFDSSEVDVIDNKVDDSATEKEQSSEVKEEPSFEEDFFSTSSDSVSSSSSEEPRSIDNEIRDLIAERVRESEAIERDASRLASATVHGYDFESGPRLPEEGLRSGIREHVMRILRRQEICGRDDTTWSEWVSCLHLRMGLPRWLTAVTLSLGVVFIIWLCLVIPQNAPRQRIRLTANAKEIEAMQGAKMQPQYVSTITTTTVASGPPSYDKLEQPPPTYDETGLRVNIPGVHSTVVKTRVGEEEEEQAGPLPEKKRPADDNESTA